MPYYFVKDEDRKLDQYCYCIECGNPLWNNSGWTWSREGGIQCSLCHGREMRSKRKKTLGTPNSIQHSKPLHPRNGASFYPDKMQRGEYRYTFLGTSAVSGRAKYGDRIKHSNKIDDRQYRKRQRRVDQYYIDQQLEEMDYEVARED